MMRLLIKPIHGYGWSAGKHVLDVPQPFELEVTVISSGEPFGAALGTLNAPNHLLSYRWILLSPRRNPFDGDCNLLAFIDKPDTTKPLTSEPLVSGFVSIAQSC